MKKLSFKTTTLLICLGVYVVLCTGCPGPPKKTDSAAVKKSGDTTVRKAGDTTKTSDTTKKM